MRSKRGDSHISSALLSCPLPISSKANVLGTRKHSLTFQGSWFRLLAARHPTENAEVAQFLPDKIRVGRDSLKAQSL